MEGVGESRSHLEKNKIRKSSQNSPILVLIFWGSIPCVFCVYNTLLKVVNDYDLSAPSVMGFRKSLDRGWQGVVSSIQF